MRNLLLSFCSFCLVGLAVNAAFAQNGPDRKWVPAPAPTLGTGYYVVDSYDAAPPPWRPSYRWQDTLYQYKLGLWHHIANGPNAFIPNPMVYTTYWHKFGNDSTDNTFAGPIPIGFNFNFYGNDYDSVYLSSNGYIGFGSYNRAVGNDGPSYKSYAVAGAFPSSAVPKNIAAFMLTDGHIVHGNPDVSMCYYKTNLSNDTFFLSFYNYIMTNGAWQVGGCTPATDKIKMDVQIVLTRQDSSITFEYRNFYGVVNCGLFAFQTAEVFQIGCARTGGCQNWMSMIGVQDSTQSQGTTYMAAGVFTDKSGRNTYMNPFMAVEFKRWRNICQADSILFPPRNYEMLLGDSLNPIAVFGNVAPTPQTFYCMFRIRNLITGHIVYAAQDSVKDLGSLKTQRIYFPSYKTYIYFDDEVGTMFAEAIARPFKNQDQFIGDYWPFDDTLREKIFVIKQITNGFTDYNNDFSTPVLLPGTIPDALKWVNINAQVVDGELFTFLPPPPRGIAGDSGGTQLQSPVIMMDRRDDGGVYYNHCLTNVGDTLISFPVDLHTTKSALLGFSFERSGRNTYPRWYDLSSALGPERTVVSAQNPKNALRIGDSLEVEYANPYQVTNVSDWQEKWSQDGGKDFHFYRVYLPIDSTYCHSYFRFRVRLKASDNFVPGRPSDDPDAWFLDNFDISASVKPELEVSYVRITDDWPYLRVPASQAAAVPVEVSVANNGGAAAKAFALELAIYKLGGAVYPYKDPITGKITPIPLPIAYRAFDNIPAILPGEIQTVTFGWNAQQSGQGTFYLTAKIDPANYDGETENDSTYNTVTMTFDSSYVYDSGTNDLPAFFGLPGLGLSLQENSSYGSPIGGVNGGNVIGSGTIAVKFRVYQTDTLKGVQAYFASLNQASDPIRVSIYNSPGNSATPGDTQQGVCAATLVTNRQSPWDGYSTYLFPCPVILQPHDYWIGVSQLSETGFELGGNASRSSVDWLAFDEQWCVTGSESHIFTMNYPELNGRFAFENTALSKNWYPFYYPAGTGKPGYGYYTAYTALDECDGQVPYPACRYDPPCRCSYPYYIGQGSWIPMIRPYMGLKPYGPTVYDSSVIPEPVEMTAFTGKFVPNYVALNWTTASELNNSGYYVERRVKGTSDWAQLNETIIPGAGTTAAKHEYAYNDVTVALETTYQYRLRQVDNDGLAHYSNAIEVTTPAADYDLAQNYPNPFAQETQISYTLPVGGNVTLKIYDVRGDVVRTLVDGFESSHAQPYNVTWDGKSDDGAKMPSGSYLYKMEVNGQVFSHMLTLAR